MWYVYSQFMTHGQKKIKDCDVWEIIATYWRNNRKTKIYCVCACVRAKCRVF